MKTSQKGTKLNDVRCFRQSRPYARRRITKSRLIPDLPGLHGSAKEEIPLSFYPRSSIKSRDRCVTLDRNQRSREIAWISFTSDSEDAEGFPSGRDNSSGRRRDTFVETEPEQELLVCFPEAEDSATEAVENARVGRKLEAEKEVQVELELQVEEKNIGVNESAELTKELELLEESKTSEELKPPDESKPSEKSENFTVLFPVKPEAHGNPEREVRQEIPQVRPDKNSFDSEKSFWLRYSGVRKILDFFGHLLGKRGAEDDDKEVAGTVEVRHLVERSVGRSSAEAKRKRPDSPTRIRTKKSSKRKNAPARSNKATRQPEDPGFSGLARQMMSTRDKRLRAALMEHEIRARRLEEENRRYRRILEEKLKTRQMSSPLH